LVLRKHQITFNNIYTLDFSKGAWEFDALLKDIGDNCTAYFSLVAMPARKENGELEKSKDGDYYCDAQKGGGVLCP